MSIGRLINRYRRRWWGSYSIDDPRPFADEAPYTYFLPSENELLAVAPGDLAKIVFRSVPAGIEWDVERMWVTISDVDGEQIVGRLANDPFDMPQLRLGDEVRFRISDVIDIDWKDGRVPAPPRRPARRQYWERCMVDDCVLTGASRVAYLYREEPDMEKPGDDYPDSGWRIRGTDAGIEADEIADRTPQYVALGTVLNRDDSWLFLIDAEIGSRFIRDEQTGAFVSVKAEET